MGAAALFAVGSAQAAVVGLEFSGDGISGVVDLAVSGTGAVVTVTGVTGGTITDPAGTFNVTGLASYAGDDQKLLATNFVDFAGISLATAGGGDFNIFSFGPGSYGVLLSTENPIGDPENGQYYSVSINDPSVPELGTWAMMGLGFASLAVAAMRGRRTAVAALS
jgi:hypothetical protein